MSLLFKEVFLTKNMGMSIERQLSTLDEMIKKGEIEPPTGKRIFEILMDPEIKKRISDYYTLMQIVASFTEVPEHPKNPEEEKLRQDILKEFLEAGYTLEQFEELFGGESKDPK